MKNVKGYAWKNERTAAFYHATAEQAHEAFEEIRRRDGKLTPAAVVDSARPEESVLHEDFEWRDDVAAEKYRQGQARQMVGAVRIIREERPPVRAYVNDRLDADKRGLVSSSFFHNSNLQNYPYATPSWLCCRAASSICSTLCLRSTLGSIPTALSCS
jgi:quinol monooxygenase YgiN